MSILAFFPLAYVNCLIRLWEDIKFLGETLCAILFIIPINLIVNLNNDIFFDKFEGC